MLEVELILVVADSLPLDEAIFASELWIECGLMFEAPTSFVPQPGLVR